MKTPRTVRSSLLSVVIAVVVASFLVANPVSSQSAPGTVVARPATLASLIASADRATTFELVPGTYPAQKLISKRDVTLRAAQPGTVVFTADAYDNAIGLSISNSSNIAIDGIAIERVQWGVAVRSSTNITFSNVSVRDVGQRGVWIFDASSNVTIEDSRIERTGQRTGSRPDGIAFSSMGEGIYLGRGSNPADTTNTVTISGNTIYDTAAEAVDVKTGTYDVTVTSNTIRGARARTGAIALHPGSAATTRGALQVRGNIISEVARRNGRGGAGIFVSAGAEVDANVVFDTEGHGIELRDITGQSRQVQYRNNTVTMTNERAYQVSAHRTPLPEPVRWGNQGIHRLPHFPTGWLIDGEPTAALVQVVADLAAEIGDELPTPQTTTPSTTSTAPTPQAAAPVDSPTPTAPAPTTTTSAPAAVVEPTRTQRPAPAPGSFPVYDTAWQMFVRATPQQADQYFSTLADYGFTGSWAALIHHAPATYLHQHAGGGQVGELRNGEIILNDGYVAHVRSILDAADRHGRKVGVIAAWQNTYLPGGNTGDDALSNRVEGTLTTSNAYAYGRQIALKFGDHPAIAHWVFGGDAGTNNTEANKAVWREMARGVRDAGARQPIGYHTPTAFFNQLNYAGEPWLDFVAPETGHNQTADKTERELRTAVNTYDVPVWQGEPRYFGINFSSWIKPEFQNPGRAEVVADAQAAKRAGVGGYVYGDAGRWAWCLFQNGNGDATPCNPNNIRASFGDAEREVIATFR